MILIMVIVIMVIFIFMFFIFMILIVMIFFITVDDAAMIMMCVVGIIKYQIASLGHGERSHEAVLVLEVLFMVLPGAIVRVIIIVIHCWPMFWSSPPFSDNPRSRHTKFWAGPSRLIHVTNSSMGIEGIDRGDIIFVKTILSCPVIHAAVLWVPLVFWVLTLVLPLQAARYSWVIVGPRMLGLVILSIKIHSAWHYLYNSPSLTPPPSSLV